MKTNILSIDTALNTTSVALLHNGYIDTEKKICNNNHEKNILHIINSLLVRNHLTIKKFSMFSFSKGPGNFTGIRLGASIIQGLSIIHNIPIFGISTLKMLAEQAWRKTKSNKVIVCMLANSKKIYWAQYTKNNMNDWIGDTSESFLNIEEACSKINNLKDYWHIIGTGLQYLKNINVDSLNRTLVTQSHAIDLIPLTILEMKKKTSCCFSNMQLNYLNNLNY